LKYILLFVFIIFNLSIVISQNYDTTLPILGYQYIDGILNGKDIKIDIDTNRIREDKYITDKIGNSFFYNLGNNGSAMKYMFYSPYNFGFNIGISSYEPLLTNIESRKYYIIKSPYSSVKYVMGTKQEQFLHTEYTHLINKLVYTSLVFDLINSPGFYNNQKNIDKNAMFSIGHLNDKVKYNFFVSYIIDRLDMQHNGGIKYPNTFGHESNGSLYETNLIDAKTNIRRSMLDIVQTYNIRKTGTSSKGIKLNYKFNYSKYIHQYKDFSYSNIYTFYHFDSITNDSICNVTISNSLGLLYFIRQNVINIKFDYQKINLRNTNPDFTFDNIYTIMDIHKKDTVNFYYNINYKYCFSGYNSDDYDIGVLLQYRFRKNMLFNISFSRLISASYWIYNYNYSNHYAWNNDLNKIYQNTLMLTIGNKNIGILFSYYNINNFIYVNENAYPIQYSKVINVLSAHPYVNFSYRKFCMDNKILINNVDNDKYIKLPKYAINSELCYNFNIKNIVRGNTGIGIIYCDKFYADGFMPSSGLFYMQEKYKTGGYPYISLFANFKVKRLTFFVRGEHLNAGYSGYNYFTIPYYPSYGRSYKLGVNWNFYD